MIPLQAGCYIWISTPAIKFTKVSQANMYLRMERNGVVGFNRRFLLEIVTILN